MIEIIEPSITSKHKGLSVKSTSVLNEGISISSLNHQISKSIMKNNIKRRSTLMRVSKKTTMY